MACRIICQHIICLHNSYDRVQGEMPHCYDERIAKMDLRCVSMLMGAERSRAEVGWIGTIVETQGTRSRYCLG